VSLKWKKNEISRIKSEILPFNNWNEHKYVLLNLIFMKNEGE